MKKHLTSIFAVSTALLVLSGCASYRAAPLTSLSSDVVRTGPSIPKNDVVVTAKTYDKADCKRYLDRDVISKGYQPVQLYIENNSNRPYSFALSRVDLPYARPEEVAAKVHTSTVGRILGYGVPGVLLCLPLVIPAIVDGIKSSDANEALDVDFSSKVARDQTINPHSYFNKIIFVPASDYQQSFNVTLIDQETNKPKTFEVAAT